MTVFIQPPVAFYFLTLDKFRAETQKNRNPPIYTTISNEKVSIGNRINRLLQIRDKIRAVESIDHFYSNRYEVTDLL